MADAARALLAAVAWVSAGALAWSLAEYVLHRWDMHGRGSRGATSREHRRHHATADIPVITAGTWVGAALVAVFLAWAAHPAAGAGWMAAYVAYELLHRHLHATAPAPDPGPAPGDTPERGEPPVGGTVAGHDGGVGLRAATHRTTGPVDGSTPRTRPAAPRTEGGEGGDGTEARTRLGWYGRWAREHHFHHHFVDLRVNYGVTSGLWDVVLRTRRR